MKKLFCVFLLALVFFAMLVFSASAESRPAPATLEAASASANADVIVYFYTYRSSYLWGEDYLREHGRSQKENILLLIVCDDGGVYRYDLYTYGRVARDMSDDTVNAILDDPDVYRLLKAGDIEEGTAAFASAVMRYYTPATPADFFLRAIPIALIIGASVALIVCVVIYILYRRKVRSPIYPLTDFTKLDLTKSEDVFLGSSVVRHRVSSSSSGGGGGRSSSGGGGGHRGGR